MNWSVVARMLGLLGLLVGGSMIFSLPWAFPICGEVDQIEWNGIRGLILSMVISLVLGGGLWFAGRNTTQLVLRKEALAVVGLGWILAGILGALPFLLSDSLAKANTPVTLVDAFFESVSGFTTTGASILTELEDPAMVPRCIMFWRSFTHWLGGMGIIVLFVAILGQLGAGGKAMLKREVPGPITESVRPRVQESALAMWTIYMVLSLIQTIILCLLGDSLYHALCHTFGTMATGGFSTHNKSAGHYNGGWIEFTIVIFMILAGTNFTLYHLAFRSKGQTLKKRLEVFAKDVEFKSYLTIILSVSLLLTATLLWNKVYPDAVTAFQHSVFATVSIMTTTGFGTEDFVQWSEFAKGLLVLLMFIGGCAGSTGGGIKVIRWVILAKFMRFEVERAYRPNVIRPMKLGEVVVADRVKLDVTSYFCMIIGIFVGSWLLLNMIEPDTLWSVGGDHTDEKLLDCASAVAATLNNIGPGLGVVGPASNYADFSMQGKFLLTILMLLGRLELFAILVLFSPAFYRHQ